MIALNSFILPTNFHRVNGKKQKSCVKRETFMQSAKRVAFFRFLVEKPILTTVYFRRKLLVQTGVLKREALQSPEDRFPFGILICPSPLSPSFWR